MKKIILIILCLILSFSGYSQFTVAEVSGTVNMLGFRVGYKINDIFESGIQYHPPLKVFNLAGFRGVYTKYNFNKKEGNNGYMNYKPYLIASFGQIKPPKSIIYDETTFLPTKKIEVYESIFGGSLGGGFEIGSNGGFDKLKFITEFGIGRMPNFYKSLLLSTDPYSPSVIKEGTKKVFTSPFYICFGLVYNFE
jgi:hypothetical protein